MSNNRYKAYDIEAVNWQDLNTKAGGQSLVFGVDVAKEAFYAVFMRPDRQALTTIKWRHPNQTQAVVKHLQMDLSDSSIDVVMEPSGTYADALRHTLKAAGFVVYRVSPKRIHDVSELYDGVPSLHDAKAAYLICRVHLEGVSSVWEEQPRTRRNQHALASELDLYQRQHQANLNRLEAHLSRHWPEVFEHLELRSVSLAQLIAVYGDPAEISRHREQAAKQLRQISHGRLSQEKIQALLEASATSLGTRATPGERHLLQVLGQEVIRAHQAQRDVEKRISQVVAADPILTCIATVIGSNSSLVLGATQGSPLHYPNPSSYLKSLGLNLKVHSSGKQRGQLKLTKRGPAKARKYLYFAALRLIQSDSVVATWYQRKVKRDGDLKGKAIVAVMRKLAKGLWHVARGKDFDSRRLFDVQPLGTHV